MAKGRIVVVDDEPDMRAVIIKRLEKADYEVFSAENGREGLKVINEVMPDIALLDVMMPEMDGISLKEELNKSLKTIDIPVIYLTAKNTESDRTQGLTVGSVDYIGKPFDSVELITRIENAFKKIEYYNENFLRDKESGLYNKKFFEKQAERILLRRYGTSFRFGMLSVEPDEKLKKQPVFEDIKATVPGMAEKTGKGVYLCRVADAEFVYLFMPGATEGSDEFVKNKAAEVERKLPEYKIKWSECGIGMISDEPSEILDALRSGLAAVPTTV